MSEFDIRSQLEKAHADLAEVIDEVVFAENEKNKAVRNLSEFKDQAFRREESLVGCVQSLSDYVLALEERVIGPSVGTAAAALGDYHVTRSKALAVQTTDVVSKLSPSLRDVFDRLSAPKAKVESVSPHFQTRKPASQLKGSEIEDALWLGVKLADNQTLLLAKSRAAMANLHKYVSTANPPPTSQAAAEALLREVKSIREEIGKAAGYGGEWGEHHANKSSAASVAEGLERLILDVRRLYAPHLADAEASIQLGEKLSALQRDIAEKNMLIQELELAVKEANERGANRSSNVVATVTTGENKHHNFSINEDKENIEKNLANSIHVVRLLQAEVSDLRGALDEQQTVHEAAMAKMKRKNEKLSQQLQEAIAANGKIKLADESMMGATLQRDYLAKIKAFEMTIHSLNAELAALEEKASAAEAQHAETVQAIKLELQLERKDRRSEREEYDTMLNRVTTEIEKLMKENVELKQRIRQMCE